MNHAYRKWLSYSSVERSQATNARAGHLAHRLHLQTKLAGKVVDLISAGLIALWLNLIFHTGILSSEPLVARGFGRRSA